MLRNLKIFTDGGARGNPGPAASAFIVYDGNKELDRGSRFLGSATNNIAEYKAVVLALNWAKERHNVGSIIFFIDSELVVKQLTGLYKIKNPNLQTLAKEIKSLERELGLVVGYHHIPRTRNKEADAAVNETLDIHS